ncbi:5-oxoprolinase subunit PxpA [Glaciecola sp. 1036]|uniref:5-oxoprolinase subunit PxpA n=1 Tax=Alteromonadaceae TaxID=72275 RepID=UPI003D0885A9
MKLNADLGESYGNWQHNHDADIMPYIDMANVACGYHAGDALTMQKTIELAKLYGVVIGAHPSYPDLQGFGRRSMRIPAQELGAMLHAQLATLDGMAKCQQTQIGYVKPHGALYNDMMRNLDIFEDVVAAMASFYVRLPLMIQALADREPYQEIANKYQIELLFEAFADRRYTDRGFLQARSFPNSVLNNEQTLEQAVMLITEGQVLTDAGTHIMLKADTICVHGDNPEALSVVQKIRQMLNGK